MKNLSIKLLIEIFAFKEPLDGAVKGIKIMPRFSSFSGCFQIIQSFRQF
jgi:hypothetical protein